MKSVLPTLFLALAVPALVRAVEPVDPGEELLEKLDLEAAQIICVPLLDADDEARVELELPVVDGLQAKLDLVPLSVRSRDFKLYEGGKGKLRERKPAKSHTFRGRYKIGRDEAGSAAVSLLRGRVKARLLPDKDLPDIYIEPLDRDDHIAYTPGDVEEPTKSCGTETGEAGEIAAGAAVTSAATGLFECELAVDVDYEMYQLWSSNVDRVQENVEDLINKMNVQYERDVGVRMVLSALVVRTSASDNPYSSNDPNTLLGQLNAELWTGSLKSVRRDIAHLFTGRDLSGSVIGIAYMGVVCGTYGSGLSQVGYTTVASTLTDLIAHEIGHNFNAQHCSCAGYTMNPYITSANQFNAGSIDEIVQHRDSRSCLDEPEDAGDVLPPSVSITEPADGASLSGPVHIVASASDESGIGDVQFYLNGVSLGADSTSPYEMSFDAGSYGQGSMQIRVVATDSAQNSAEDTIAVELVAPVDPDDPGQAFVDANGDHRYIQADGDALLPASVLADGRFDVRALETGYGKLVANGGVVFPPSLGEIRSQAGLEVIALGDIVLKAPIACGGTLKLTSLYGDLLLESRMDAASDLLLGAPDGSIFAPGVEMSGNNIALTGDLGIDIGGAVLDGRASAKAVASAGELSAQDAVASANEVSGVVLLKCQNALVADGAMLSGKIAQLISGSKSVSARSAHVEACAADGIALIQAKLGCDASGCVVLGGRSARVLASQNLGLDLTNALVANTGNPRGEVAVRGKVIRVEGARILDAGPDQPNVSGQLIGTPVQIGVGIVTCNN